MTRTRDANRVKARRRALGMDQKELAKCIRPGAGPMLSMIEGGFVPHYETQIKIAAALSTTPEALWPEEYA